MAWYKGAGIVFLRELVVKAQALDRLSAALTGEERKMFLQALEISMIPVELAGKIFTLTAEILHPQDPLDDGLFALGQALATSSFNRVYQMAFRLFSTTMLINQAAKVWRTYHGAGRCEVQQVEPAYHRLVLHDYPALPVNIAQATSGYISGLVLLTGVETCRVTKRFADAAWYWDIDWGKK